MMNNLSSKNRLFELICSAAEVEDEGYEQGDQSDSENEIVDMDENEERKKKIPFQNKLTPIEVAVLKKEINKDVW